MKYAISPHYRITKPNDLTAFDSLRGAVQAAKNRVQGEDGPDCMYIFGGGRYVGSITKYGSTTNNVQDILEMKKAAS